MMQREDWLRVYGGTARHERIREAPLGDYDQFLKVVDTPGPILELACGNGLLLRYLHDLSGLGARTVRPGHQPGGHRGGQGGPVPRSARLLRACRSP